MARPTFPLLTLAVLLAGVSPSAAGPNPEAKLAMHVLASSAYLTCDDLEADLAANGLDASVTPAEMEAAGGYVYVALVVYDYTGVCGVEYSIGGWPRAWSLR